MKAGCADSHAPRKIFHAITGSVIPTVYLLEWAPRSWIVAGIVIVTIAWFAFDTARLKSAAVNDFFFKYFHFLMKKKEMKTLTGVSYLLGGMSIALLLFSPPIAVASLYFISLGDPAAAIIGKRFGRHRLHNGRSLEGSLAMFVVCVAVGVGITGFPWSVAIAGAVAASAAELYSGAIDDNLTAPVISGALMSAII